MKRLPLMIHSSSLGLFHVFFRENEKFIYKSMTPEKTKSFKMFIKYEAKKKKKIENLKTGYLWMHQI